MRNVSFCTFLQILFLVSHVLVVYLSRRENQISLKYHGAYDAFYDQYSSLE